MKKLCCLVVCMMFLVGTGCDEETSATPDAGAKPDLVLPDLPIPDKNNPWPDIWGPESGGGDGLVPDIKQPYTSSPFGCRGDSECFGQRCCPTPWGVKLCAPSCGVPAKP